MRKRQKSSVCIFILLLPCSHIFTLEIIEFLKMVEWGEYIEVCFCVEEMRDAGVCIICSER